MSQASPTRLVKDKYWTKYFHLPERVCDGTICSIHRRGCAWLNEGGLRRLLFSEGKVLVVSELCAWLDSEAV